MARFTTGDINHKFLSGIQSSDAASQFGGEQETTSIPYFYASMNDFDTEQLEELIDELNEKYGEAIHLDTDPEYLYGDDAEDKKEWRKMIQNDVLVVDVQLGLLIYQCIKEKGHCEFDAEI